jgi:predicted Fe-S protein YdhL (DUF1289 family)
MTASDAAARSPCIRNCCLDDDDTCLGCFRSLEEIKVWSTASDAERSVILQNAGRRREARRLHVEMEHAPAAS